MGLCKEHLMEIEQRGYGDSDKMICAFHFGDAYIKGKIKYSHNYGKCSFCGKRRNVLSFEDVMELIMPIVWKDYLPAEGNAPYDSEEKEYMAPIIDPYSFVYDELNSYLEIEDDSVLKELFDLLSFEDRVSPYRLGFKERQEEIDIETWNQYCKLVKETPFSAEQIVSLSDKPRELVTEDIYEIRYTLDMIWSYCRELSLVKTISGLSGQYKAKRIYRCVNYLPKYEKNQAKYAGLSFIPATILGTAPSIKVSDNRMSETGDMMFYGADDKDTARNEVGTNGDNPITIATFCPNKNFRILDLSTISSMKCPSIFDTANATRRSNWFFLKEFMERISEVKKDSYKPTQVLTKYIQRKAGVQGIKYSSSKNTKGCYVLFVVNRDCLDWNDRRNSERNQLILEKVEQLECDNQKWFLNV